MGKWNGADLVLDHDGVGLLLESVGIKFLFQQTIHGDVQREGRHGRLFNALAPV